MNCENVWQAVYTAGVVLPRPVSECRHLDEELLQNGTCHGFRFYSGKVMDGDGLFGDDDNDDDGDGIWAGFRVEEALQFCKGKCWFEG